MNAAKMRTVYQTAVRKFIAQLLRALPDGFTVSDPGGYHASQFRIHNEDKVNQEFYVWIEPVLTKPEHPGRYFIHLDCPGAELVVTYHAGSGKNRSELLRVQNEPGRFFPADAAHIKNMADAAVKALS